MPDHPTPTPLTLDLPSTHSLSELLDSLKTALREDSYPVATPRMCELAREVVSIRHADSFGSHLHQALARPDEPVHPLCMLALYEDLLPRVGREVGLRAGGPPHRWLPSDMPRTRVLARRWQQYANAVLEEMSQAMRRSAQAGA